MIFATHKMYWRWLGVVFPSLAYLAVAAVLHCTVAAAAAPIVRIAIEPERTLLFGRDAQQRLLVTGYSSNGVEYDLTREAKFSTANPEIATVDDAGVITSHAPGLARVKVSVDSLSASSRALVLDREQRDTVNFVRDIQPILTMKGCAGANCHGSMNGKGGFKLSQFGYDADLDYQMIAREADGRRVDLQNPSQSLILQKPTSSIPHGGGTRFDLNSQEYRLLARWIAQGAPNPASSVDIRIEKLEVIPAERILAQPGAEQQLIVLAHYTDRTIRDVTTEVQYVPKDESIASVTANGLVQARRDGETAVLIRATGALGVARVAVLRGKTIDKYPKLTRNNFIDDLVFDKLRRLHILPSELSSDDVFLRRTYLDAIGTLPTSEEVREFLKDQRPDKRQRLIGNLLERTEYADYWGLLWGDLLTVTAFKTGPTNSLYLDHWIREQFRNNVPLDRFVQELVAGTGSLRKDPGMALALARAPEQAAGYFSQLFLGVRIQCAECHDHPFENWKQDDYFGMVAFFSQVSTRASKQGTLVYDDPAKETKHPRTKQPVQPHFLGSPDVLHAGATRRQQLANWITDPGNPFFSRAIANRVWAHFMKVGLVDPVDDFRETNPPTNPQLLDALARHFVDSGYDLKALMRAVMESRVYQLSSATNDTNDTDNQHYSHYFTRRLYAEPLLDAITRLTGAPHSFRFGYAGMKAVELHDPVVPDSFLGAFDRNRREITCQRGENITLGQSLALISGDAINNKLRFQGGRIDQLVQQGLSDAEIIEALFLSALGRYPAQQEVNSLVDAIRSSGTRRHGLEDTLWALINSREFLFNH